jgi:hypothetical protein
MPDDADTIRNRIGQENADALQAKLAAWFGPDSEYAGYDEDLIKELGRNAV